MRLQSLLVTGAIWLGVSTTVAWAHTINKGDWTTTFDSDVTANGLYDIELPEFDTRLGMETAPDGTITRFAHSKPYLTLSLSIDNDTIYANDVAIYPPVGEMRINAIRRWYLEKKTPEIVPLTYSLDVVSLPPREAAPAVELSILHMRLLDVEGNLAVKKKLAIQLLRDPKGDLSIPQVQVVCLDTVGSKGKVGVWMTVMDGLAEQLSSYLRDLEEAFEHRLDSFQSLSTHKSSAFSSLESSGSSRKQHPFSHHKAHKLAFMHFLRPVVLPACLGIAAGLLAGAVGFLLGRFVVSVYLCLYQRQHRQPEPFVMEERNSMEKLPLSTHCEVSKMESNYV
ncbi:hypothetical protein ASPZODRAFT_143442 [Penicilliopsis zonata CBS 506.65]|uniref:Uncharacterized protein n=1 Tax=Penicilliopsis zonata CBS 506.65 TaxID=1073090 RepID=A0A1L9SE93_9EURO|nr:hypothetical protein ASPZODRAFT_143442 [Penicilliopsis zonata CBS 506.65]OJJ45550.1 hypothetical protein ASPZODRAFT_143442 [Penicilliopsis zonata CBS 506.65]